MAKTKERTEMALARIDELKERLIDLSASDQHELIKALDARNYIQCSELAHRAALVRKESRYYQFREDYPYRDDKDWLKWVVQWRDEDGVATRLEPVPIYRYPVRPEKLERTPAKIQMHIKDEP